MLSLETILKDTIWVAKMTWGRYSGTYEEVGHYSDSDSCRDFDLCCKQPEHLKEFYDGFFNYTETHGFITIQDYYKVHYGKGV